MTKEQLKSLRDAIDAHLKGEPVQWLLKSYIDADNSWIDEPNPHFNNGSEWRPKPNALKLYICRGYNELIKKAWYAAFETMKEAEAYKGDCEHSNINLAVLEMVEAEVKK